MRETQTLIFFHTTTLNRRRTNEINILLNEEGKYIHNQESIKTLTLKHFQKSFETSHRFSIIDHKGTLPQKTRKTY